MATTSITSDTRETAVAPAWHTVIVLAVVLGISLLGGRTRNLPFVAEHGHARARGYLVVMLIEWATVAFIWYGVRLRGVRLRDLVGGRWSRFVEIIRDLGISIAFLIVSMTVLSVLGHILKATPNQAIRNLFPHGALEIVAYLMLAATAGFCEEVMFRGYLQRQFGALTRAAAGGIILQGIAFGAAHGYQGWRYMLMIAVFGILFGLLAEWRRSLRPGMLAHFLQDGIGGLAGPHLVKNIF